MAERTLEPYVAEDRDACLAILDGNSPRYFGIGDRREYIEFLGAPPGRYFVLRGPGGEVLACGGIATLEAGRTGVLTWGMVRADMHRRGLGSILTTERVRMLYDMPTVECIKIDTTNEAAGFYEHLGFSTSAVAPGYYGPGLDRHEMVRTRRRTPDDGPPRPRGNERLALG